MSKCEYCGADVRVDDSSPITEDWLRAVGFKDYCAADKWCSSYLSLWIDPREHNCAFLAVHWARPTHPDGPYWSANSFSLYKPAYPKTRGDVRRLALALGMPLPSPPEAGE
jgi:hypothetical protein